MPKYRVYLECALTVDAENEGKACDYALDEAFSTDLDVRAVELIEGSDD